MKTITETVLAKFYDDIANTIQKPKWVYFHGGKYKIGSKNLKQVLRKWYKYHSLEVPIDL